MENKTFRIKERYPLMDHKVYHHLSSVYIYFFNFIYCIYLLYQLYVINVSVALQFPEGLLLFACTIADIIER